VAITWELCIKPGIEPGVDPRGLLDYDRVLEGRIPNIFLGRSKNRRGAYLVLIFNNLKVKIL
jgi:hypothetical protein